MARRGVHGLPLAGGRPVAEAVVRRAQVRAALDHVAREPAVGVRAAAVGRVRGGGGVALTRPLPDVAGHVVEAVAVGRERAPRGRAAVSVDAEVLPGELPLPRVRPRPAAWELVVAPREARAL